MKKKMIIVLIAVGIVGVFWKPVTNLIFNSEFIAYGYFDDSQDDVYTNDNASDFGDNLEKFITQHHTVFSKTIVKEDD